MELGGEAVQGAGPHVMGRCRGVGSAGGRGAALRGGTCGRRRDEVKQRKGRKSVLGNLISVLKLEMQIRSKMK